MSKEQIETDRIQQERDEIAQTIADNFGCCDIDKYDASDFEWAAFQVQNKGYRKQEWISVEERLPEHLENVLACDTEGKIHTATYVAYDTGRGVFCSPVRNVHHFTHWMPLPAPPKGGEG